MIPQERIEQAAGAYYDELLKEKNRTTGQFVGVPLTHKEIGSQVTGYIEGMTAGDRFAESELKSLLHNDLAYLFNHLEHKDDTESADMVKEIINKIQQK